MSNYNDSHRLFVQSMLTKRIVTEEEAKRLFVAVCERTGRSSNGDYPKFIGDINRELDSLDFSLKNTHSERDGSSYLVFTNVKQDSFTEMATTFKPTEIVYIRELFDKIVNADNEDFAISGMKAIRLGGTVKLSQRETQNVLDQLIKDKWIALEERGVYYIAMRGIAELQSYLREQYGEVIQECTMCLDIITMGERCQTENCPVRIHQYCAAPQFGNTTAPVCPQCNAPWDRNNLFGLGLPDTANGMDQMSNDEE